MNWDELTRAFLDNSAALGIFSVFTWYVSARLKKCEEGRDVLQAENKDLAVRVARLEEKHQHDGQ